MSRLALYRKYRPSDFGEAVGQEHITQTLENAISKGQAAHAYLFTGPRGVGKTTVARIVAKRLNGLGPDDDIANELDIVEIDGASNRGIDEIRSLREKVQLAPSKLEYKVYIIDEVHMLTREAFNALLKTLEEPPEHVVFVFATTEIQKVPDTIISRTQRFDFRPIAAQPLQKQLVHIAKSEGIKIDDDAIELIATISRGGFRDAISLLDQLSVNAKGVTADLVRKFTGLQDPKRLSELIIASANADGTTALKHLQDLYEEGADPVVMTQQLLDIVQLELLSPSIQVTQQQLLATAQRLHEAQVMYRSSTLPQLVLQVALSKQTLRATQAEEVVQHKPKSQTSHEATETKDQPSKQKTVKGPAKPEVGNVQDKTIKALSVIKHDNNSLYAVLRGSQLEVQGEAIEVHCRFSFHRDRMRETRNIELIEKAFSKVFGKTMHANIQLEDSSKPSESKTDPDNELVNSAMAILGGELVEG